MKLPLALAAFVLLTACSSEPVETVEKAPPPPAQPITGRQAVQSTFGVARGWAPDAQPVRVRNFNLIDVPSDSGNAGAWEVTFASASLSSVRLYTWSAAETQGLQKGVLGGSQGSWSPGGRDLPFDVGALLIDTPEALATAMEHATTYLATEGEKPQVTFLLEQNSRFPQPAWRVMWGDSPNSAEFSVYVNAVTGEYLGR